MAFTDTHAKFSFPLNSLRSVYRVTCSFFRPIPFVHVVAPVEVARGDPPVTAPRDQDRYSPPSAGVACRLDTGAGATMATSTTSAIENTPVPYSMAAT